MSSIGGSVVLVLVLVLVLSAASFELTAYDPRVGTLGALERHAASNFEAPAGSGSDRLPSPSSTSTSTSASRARPRYIDGSSPLKPTEFENN